jgi:hypothetical protein
MSDCTQQCSHLLSKASFLQEAAHHDCMSASMIDVACWLYNCSTVSVMHAASPVDAQAVVKDSFFAKPGEGYEKGLRKACHHSGT